MTTCATASAAMAAASGMATVNAAKRTEESRMIPAKGQIMNFYVCEYCGAAFEAESEQEARDIAEECAEL